MPIFKYVVDKKYDNIISFLESFYLAKTKINMLLSEKRIKINNEEAKRLASLNINDEILIDFPMKLTEKKVKYKLDILYEDDHVLLINKPAGLIVHSDGTDSVSLDNYVAAYLPNLDPMHVHRLDFETTGIIMYAKDPLCLAYFNEALSKHEINRIYLALCLGKFKEVEGTINRNIGRDRHVNGKMIVYKNGKEAITHYKVEKQYSKYALVSLKLETGRTHQIRVHMSSIGHPLINDIMYNGPDKGGRVMLHSSEIYFYHPIKKKVEHIRCKPNKDMLKYLT